jgi:hypothetical protein
VKLLYCALLLAAGATVAPVRVEDQDAHARSIPSGKPTLVIYEDQDARAQSRHAKDVIGRVNTLVENQARVDVLPIADLEKWNWWPAKKYALADIRKKAKETRSTIYLDWTGALRKSWGLERKQSHLVLVDGSGRVLWAHAGECGDDCLRELIGKLAALGVDTQR